MNPFGATSYKTFKKWDFPKMEKIDVSNLNVCIILNSLVMLSVWIFCDVLRSPNNLSFLIYKRNGAVYHSVSTLTDSFFSPSVCKQVQGIV